MTEVQKLPVKRLEDSQVSIQSVGGGGMVAPRTMAEVIEFADIMTHSGVAIRACFRNNKPICVALTMQALRWEIDPFALANKAYVVNDMLAYEAQLIAAIVHTRAPLKRRPIYDFDGEGDTLTCKVTAEFLDGTVQTYGSPSMGELMSHKNKKNGKKIHNSPLWESDPQQQLGYFSIARFARRYCPEVILGIYSQEEAEQFERNPEDAVLVNPDQEPSFVASLEMAKENPMPGNFEGFNKDIVSEVVENPPNQRFPDQMLDWPSRSQEERERHVKSIESGNGGFKKADLAKIDVSWPPPKGWRKTFEETGHGTQATQEAQEPENRSEGPDIAKDAETQAGGAPDPRAEMFKAGREARKAGIALDQAPDVFEGDYAEYWRDGWADMNDELTQDIVEF